MRARGAVLIASAACAAVGLPACGGGDDVPTPSSAKPVPAYYLTASSAKDLENQAHDAAVRFARRQGDGSALLMLDFGAARSRGGEWGVSLRSGTFFSNDEVHSALQAAADGYDEAHRRGEVTIVYVTSNANLGDPGRGYEKFDAGTAHEAGEEQVSAIRNLRLGDDVSVAVGGDIEPGYDMVAPTEVSLELVAGAVDEFDGPYYNVGTAPCRGGRCVNGWTPKDVCAVSSGGGRQVLPEVYFAIQAPGWEEVARTCGIGEFAGVSASPIGDLSPAQSRKRLREAANADVGEAVAVWPG